MTPLVAKPPKALNKAAGTFLTRKTKLVTKFFVLGENVVEGIRIKNNQTGKQEKIPITGLFIAIGHQPNTGLFKEQLDMDDAGYLITEGKSTKTNVPGVFASGDVQDKEYRQAVTAAGTGCMAALDAERYLQSLA